MEFGKAIQRWVVDVSKWNPSLHDFSFFMSFLPQHEHSSITGFMRLEDRKRALVSRLLQHSLVHHVLGIPFDEVVISRTDEGKPYLVGDNKETGYPNFNFNVSHHGDYVAIASEPLCIVGLDIVSHSVLTNETDQEFIQNFSSCFSSSEWFQIMSSGSSNQKLSIFYRYWCLKEAYVKAMGSGVGNKLDDIEFEHNGWQNISVKVCGEELKDWKFWLLELDQNHSVAISRGHPKTAIKSYKKTLKQTEFHNDVYDLALHLPNPSFTFKKVEDLLPVSRNAYTSTLCYDLSSKYLMSENGDCCESPGFSSNMA